MEECRVEFNKKYDKVKDIRSKLYSLNDNLSYYDIKDLYDTYLKQKEEQLEEYKKLKTLEDDASAKEKIYNKLRQDQKNIRVAVDVINHGLQYVFFSKKRLSIK